MPGLWSNFLNHPSLTHCLPTSQMWKLLSKVPKRRPRPPRMAQPGSEAILCLQGLFPSPPNSPISFQKPTTLGPLPALLSSEDWPELRPQPGVRGGSLGLCPGMCREIPLPSHAGREELSVCLVPRGSQRPHSFYSLGLLRKLPLPLHPNILPSLVLSPLEGRTAPSSS